jgi:glyoxylase-like metal-dependent hydrolase (beta-lactamase superfamily II)
MTNGKRNAADAVPAQAGISVFQQPVRTGGQMKVTDGIYSYPWTNMWENNCNSYIFKKNETTILVDPGLKRYVPALFISAAQDGIKEEDISLVINTHAHPDHLDGNSHFLERNIKVALSEEEGKFLQSTGKDFFRMFGLEQPGSQIDISLKEGEFKTNDIELQVLLTPGHSPGSICLYWPEKKALISGDVIFSESVGRTDFPGGSGELLKQSIEQLSTLDVEYLLPGHNEIVTGKNEVKKNFEFIKRAFFSYM